MTGAAAGQAGGAQAGSGDAGDGEARGPVDGQGQPDLAALASTLGDEKGNQEQLRAQVTQLQEYLKSQPWADGPPAAGESDADAGPDEPADFDDEMGEGEGDVDLSFLEHGDFMDDPREMAEALADVFDRAVGEQLKPMQQELASQRDAIAEAHQAHQFELLAAEIPALQDPDVAREIGEAAQQLAEAMGRPELAGDAHLWKITAMAAKAAELAAEEEDAETPRAAHLEGGGGAAPAGAQIDPLGPMFDEAGQGGKNALPFH